MTIGKITSSNQDLVYVEVRPETGEFLETRIDGILTSLGINGTFGSTFTAEHWFDRVVVAMVDGGGRDLVIRLYDNPEKITLLHETVFQKVGESAALHLIFEPLPPGSYYWEIDTKRRMVIAYIYAGSSYHGAYRDGEQTTNYDFRSKIMYCTDELQQIPVAIEGDPVDNGITTVKEGSSLLAVSTGVVEKNIATELDELANGGRILTGSWYLEA